MKAELREMLKDHLVERMEGKESLEEDDPCWDDYEMVGMKKKNGKKVPNCVPKES